MSDRRFGVTLVFWLVFGPTIALAGPPFFTDDPVPVDLRHWEVYAGSQFVRTHDGATGASPFIEANYGALENLQLHAMTPMAVSDPRGGPSAYGYGDTEIGAKFRFVQESDGVPQMAVFPALELPTGDSRKGLGNGRAQLYLPLWLQKSWGPWTSYGGGGYWINPGTGNRNWVYTGWLLQRDLSRSLTAGGEIFHRTPDTDGGPSATGFSLGGQFNLNDHYHLLFSSGRDFSGPNRFTLYTGIQWTY